MWKCRFKKMKILHYKGFRPIVTCFAQFNQGLRGAFKTLNLINFFHYASFVFKAKGQDKMNQVRSFNEHIIKMWSHAGLLITCSWHQKTKPQIHQFTNLKCCMKSREPFKPLFNGVFFLIYYFKNILSLAFSF